MSDWTRTTRAEPCPICGKNGWCTVSADKTTAKCMHVEQGAFKSAEDGSGLAHFHQLIESDDWRDRPAPAPRPPKKINRDIAKLARVAEHAITDTMVQGLADELGLSAASLRRMGLGWLNARQLEQYDTSCSGRGCWAFPMADASGTIVGIRLRTTDGFKYAVKTGDDCIGAGIFVPRDLGQTGKPIVIVTEGPTDCAALLDIGFDAIGRPSNTGGTDMMRMLIIAQTHACNWREVVILIDRDKPGSDAAKNTWRGARSLAAALASPRRSVRICQPPIGINDARDWLKSGANEDDVMAVIDAEEAQTVGRFDWMKEGAA